MIRLVLFLLLAASLHAEDNPTVEDIDFEVCLGYLNVANRDGDDILSRPEFAEVVQLKSNCTTNPDDNFNLTLPEAAIYTALATAQCATQSFSLACLDIRNVNASIAGINSSPRSDEETQRLRTVCGFVTTLQLIDCALQDVNLTSDNATSVEDIDDDVLSDCYEQLLESDSDVSMSLDVEEFTLFLDDFNGCGGREALNVAERTAFVSLACLSAGVETASCLFSPQQAAIELYGSFDSLNMPQKRALTPVCVRAEDFGCGFDDDDAVEDEDEELVVDDDTDDILTPEVDLSACYDLLKQANEDNNDVISRTEFGRLVELKSNCSQVVDDVDLSNIEGPLYTTLVVSQCPFLGFNISCITNAGNGTVTVRGLYSSNRTDTESTLLGLVCTSIEVARALDCTLEEFTRAPSAAPAIDDRVVPTSIPTGVLPFTELPQETGVPLANDTPTGAPSLLGGPKVTSSPVIESPPSGQASDGVQDGSSACYGQGLSLSLTFLSWT